MSTDKDEIIRRLHEENIDLVKDNRQKMDIIYLLQNDLKRLRHQVVMSNFEFEKVTMLPGPEENMFKGMLYGAVACGVGVVVGNLILLALK